ncbi:MAG: C69 family dipeptidase [Bacteroidales bacterium]|nr:C69 family dipeptidase [Bacteroidales bacterium]
MKGKTLLIVLATALLSSARMEACTNVIVTKGASADGSVMVTYSADSHQLYGECYFSAAGRFAPKTWLEIVEWDSGKRIGQIAQVPQTYQTVGNMNQYQVTITETTFGGREELSHQSGASIDYGSLIYITLQRAKSAREAIETIATLMDEYGYASAGESFSVADKNEAWIMEIIGKGEGYKGAVWAAARIPDGYICSHANQSRIHHIDFADKENWLYSEDVVDFARTKGYFAGEDKDFSFCDAYNPLDFSGARACEARVWSAFNILTDGNFNGRKADEWLDFAMGLDVDGEKMPLYVKATKPVTFRALADVMRDHYEGTPMDMTADAGAGGHHTPYRWRPMYFQYEGKSYLNERAIATQQTGFWILCQSRSWLPDVLGGVLWIGMDDAATSALTPVYTNVKEVPQPIRVGNGNMITYSETSQFWINNRVAQFAYLLYDRVAPVVREKILAHEDGCLEDVKVLEEQALKILGSDPGKKQIDKVRSILTDFSNKKSWELLNTWKDLDRFLMVKFMDGNVKEQNPDGSFKTIETSATIPTLTQPGYSEQWKRAVSKDLPEHMIAK